MSVLTDQRDLVASQLADVALEHLKGAAAVKVYGNYIVLTVDGIKYSIMVSVKRKQI